MPRICQLSPEALRMAAPDGARWLVVALTDEIAATIPRVADLADPEALHDFRVAVRRLRASLRAHAPVLGAEVENFRRSLRTIAAATSASRDAEVQLEWLSLHRDSFSAGAAPGIAALSDRLREIRIAGRRHTNRVIEAEFPAVESALRDYVAGRESDATEAFTAHLWHTVIEHCDDLESKMSGVSGMFDESRAHKARISAKRLRYVIEPLVTAVPFTELVVTRLGELQEILGALRDRQAMGPVLRQEMGLLQADRDRWFEELSSGTGGPPHASPPELAGLMELARVSRAEQLTLYETLEREWRGAAAAEFFRSVRELAERISLIIPQLI